MWKSVLSRSRANLLATLAIAIVSVSTYAAELSFSYPTYAGLTFGTNSNTPDNYWYFPTSKPSGATVQWTSFYWYSNNFLAQLPPPNSNFGGQHLAAGTRMKVVLADENNSDSINGIGLAMGPGDTDIGGCGVQYSAAQVEQWGSGTPALIASTCSGGGQLQDGVTYLITIGSNDAGYIYYEVRDSSTDVVVASYSYLGPTQPTPNDRLFVYVAPGVINDTWSVAIWGIQFGWY